MKLWIGCSGWQYSEWEKKFYPQNLPTSAWFEFYTQHFNSVEINYTHYHNITAQNLKKWYMQAPKNFRYSLKAHQLFTHYKKFKDTKKLLKIFYEKTDILADKLGCILFQFPDNFIYNHQNLDNILEQMDPKKKNVIEFRHNSWWQADVLKTLQKQHIIICTVDGPELPRELLATDRRCYIRFHGRRFWYFGNYSARVLAQRVEEIKEQKIREVWAYFNNTALAYAPKNALKLRQLLNELNLSYK